MTKSLSFVIFAIIGTLTASAVGPVMADASMADALAGRFIADGDLTILPAVAPTQANAPPSYNYKEAAPDTSLSWTLPTMGRLWPRCMPISPASGTT